MKNLLFAILIFALSPLAMNAQNGVANPDNPFDIVGQIHNECLTKVFPIVGKMTDRQSKTTFPLIENYLNDLNYEGFKGYDFRTVYDDAMITELKKGFFMDAQNYFRSLGSRKMISGQLVRALSELDRIITSAPSIDELIMQIKELESRNAGAFKELDQAIFYVATSTARYSCDHWYGYFVQNSRDCCDESLIGPDWKGIGRSDVKGAVTGAVVVGTVGAVTTGGLGAGPGALVGGAAGGTGASLGEAAAQVWDWFWS